MIMEPVISCEYPQTDIEEPAADKEETEKTLLLESNPQETTGLSPAIIPGIYQNDTDLL
jgi:hypothetical protein